MGSKVGCWQRTEKRGLTLGEADDENLTQFGEFSLHTVGLPNSSVGKESACNAGDPGSILGSGRSPGEGIDYYSILAWRIPWTTA